MRAALRAQRAQFDRMKTGVDPGAPDVVRACTGKVHGFTSRKRALAAAAEISRHKGISLYVYRCRFCKGRHHLTSAAVKDHTFVVVPIPGEHNGRQGRLWFREEEDLLRIELFVDRVFYLAGLDVREIPIDSQRAI